MDETGQSGDTEPIESGSGSDTRDRARVNGWDTPESPWSPTPAAYDPEEEVPAWRRPSQEIRPFARRPLPPDHQPPTARPFPDNRSDDVRPFGSPLSPAHAEPSRPGDVRFGDTGRSGEVRQFGEQNRSGFGEQNTSGFGEQHTSGFGEQNTSGDVRRPDPAPAAEPDPPPGPRWSDSRTRYSDLLQHFSPRGPEPTGAPAAPSRFEGLTRPHPLDRPDSLADDDDRRAAQLDAPPPASAPPYPYEGDLDDARQPPVIRQRAAVPLDRPRATFPAVRPATPGGRRADWLTTAESARHAVPPAPSADTGPAEEDEPAGARASYDPSSFPRRLPNDSPPVTSAPPADEPGGYAVPATYSGRAAGDAGATGSAWSALPQRVPAEPDVPTVPEPPSVEPTAETPALARIATHLRRGDVLSSQDRQDGFDVQAILEAVREVEGVRDASLRSTPAGAHSLRLDLAEGADPAEVSRHVARLLQDRMGLDAAMQGADAATAEQTSPGPVNAPPATAFVPSQAGPTGRAAVPGSGSAPAAADELRRLPTVPQPGAGLPGSGGAPAADDELRRLPTVPQAGARRSDTAPAESGPAGGGPPGTARDAGVPRAGRAPVTHGPSDPAADRPAGTVETVPSAIECGPPRPLEVNERPGPRVMIENVQVNTFGTEATVEVRLGVADRTAAGVATGPAVDGYLLRLCAMATASAVDELLAASDHADGPARCFVEHAAAVPFGPMQVAVVVMLLSCGGWVEQLAGSAVVTGDDRHAMVRATLAAVNRRLEALLS